MFKEFLMKKMLKAKGIPDDQIEMVTKLVNKNPDLFKQIAEEVQGKIKAGKPEQEAAMEVMMAHQAEIQKLMSE